MSKLSYERLMRARFNYLREEKMPEGEERSLDQLLALPHPQREEAFVQWKRSHSQGTILPFEVNLNRVKFN